MKAIGRNPSARAILIASLLGALKCNAALERGASITGLGMMRADALMGVVPMVLGGAQT